MKRKASKLFSILLALVMLAGILPGQVAYAAKEDIAATMSDVDFGTVPSDYSGLEAINPTITNTGNELFSLSGADAKVELTGGETDAFTCGWNDGGGWVPVGGSSNSKAWVRAKNGLSVGTHTATLTLFYDYDNSGDWEAIATGNVTIRVAAGELAVVHFEPNGASGSMANKNVEKDTDYTLPVCLFIAPDGKEFAGWEIEGVTYEVNGVYHVMDDITVMATWRDVEDPVVSATITGIDFGTAEEGYTGVEVSGAAQHKNITIQNTGNQPLNNPKIELTAGDTDAFVTGAEGVPGVIPAGDTNTSFFVSVNEGLSAGTYTATITLTAANLDTPVTATVTFTVKAASGSTDKATPPQTGDESNVGLWIALMAFSMVGLVGVASVGRKRKVQGRHSR